MNREKKETERDTRESLDEAYAIWHSATKY